MLVFSWKSKGNATPPSQETRPYWGVGTLGFPCSSSSTSLLDGHDCESEVLVLFASQDTNIWANFTCRKTFQHLFFRWSTSMLTESFRSKCYLQTASQQSKTSGITQLSLDIKPLPTTNVKLPTQGSLIEIPWHRVMVHANLYTFDAKNPTLVWLKVEFRNQTNTHLIPRHHNLSCRAHLIETPQWRLDLMFVKFFVGLWYDKNDPCESTWVLMQQELGFLIAAKLSLEAWSYFEERFVARRLKLKLVHFWSSPPDVGLLWPLR